MTFSHLTTSHDALWAGILAELAENDISFNPLTTGRAEILAGILNAIDEDADASHLMMSEAQLLAAIWNALDAEAGASHLTMSVGELLAGIRNAIEGGLGPSIVLSASSQAEGTATNTTIGTLSVVGGSGSYTLTKTVDGDSAFTLTVDELKNAIVFDFEDQSSFSVTIHADNGAGSVLDRVFTISVTDVLDDVGAPVNTVAPVLSGTPTEGETSSLTPGTWTGTAPIVLTYQGYRAVTVALAIDAAASDPSLDISGLTATGTAAAYANALSNAPAVDGDKRHFGATVGEVGTGDWAVGFATVGADFDDYLGSATNGIGWWPDGSIFVNDVTVDTIESYGNGDDLEIEFNGTTQRFWGRVNGGDWNDDPAADPAAGVGGIDTSSAAAGDLKPAATLGEDNQSVTFVFATGTPSSGFSLYAAELLTDGDGNYLGVAIAGATNPNTYVYQTADVGEIIFWDEIADNGIGSPVVKSSNYTGAIAEAPWMEPGAVVDLDFANDRYFDGSLASNLTVARASSGFQRTVAGLLTSFSSNVLRRTNFGLLIEPARTNVILRSQEFNTTWAGDHATVSANATTAPDGTSTADKVEEDNTINLHLVYQSVLVPAGGTFAVYAKAADRDFLILDLYDGASHLTWFDLATGAVGTNGDGNTATIEAMASGWYRCSVKQTFGGNLAYIQVYTASADNVSSYQGVTGNGIYLWGGQLEAEASASSYIPTTTASVARAADAATIQPTGVGRVVFTFDDDSQQTVSGIDTGTQYAIPTNLNRRTIKRLTGYAS